MTEPLTLHAAIEGVLADTGQSMTSRGIADVVNEQCLYVRGDGQPVPTSQISARIRKYPALFTKVGKRIALGDNSDPRPFVDPKTESTPKWRNRSPLDGGLPAPPARAASGDSLTLFKGGNFQLVEDVIHGVPDQPGVYAIRVIEFGVLPEPFRAYAEERNDPLIYVGEAKESLRTRLGQELWAKGHGTFFRSIGAVIGHRPLPGSLAGKVNKSNYTFAPEDEAAIIRWINRNLEVSWVVLDGAVHDTEVRLIREFGPLLNLSGNPRKLPELSIVREECRRIASRS